MPIVGDAPFPSHGSMNGLRPLVPILAAAGILLGGNGLQGTLIALRGAQEGLQRRPGNDGHGPFWHK